LGRQRCKSGKEERKKRKERKERKEGKNEGRKERKRGMWNNDGEGLKKGVRTPCEKEGQI
jgi:hypothetical protein